MITATILLNIDLAQPAPLHWWRSPWPRYRTSTASEPSGAGSLGALCCTRGNSTLLRMG